jgi:3-hydroxyacyl-[acyl-carrier-protein] dehydratase
MSPTLSCDPIRATPVEALGDVSSERDDGGATVVRAVHTVTATHDYMQGHFPGFTIYPGVFLLELALRAIGATPDFADVVATGVLHIRSMRFVAPFRLGDTIVLVASVARDDDGSLEVDARFLHRDWGDGPEAARIRFALRSGGAR